MLSYMHKGNDRPWSVATLPESQGCSYFSTRLRYSGQLAN